MGEEKGPVAESGAGQGGKFSAEGSWKIDLLLLWTGANDYIDPGNAVPFSQPGELCPEVYP